MKIKEVFRDVYMKTDSILTRLLPMAALMSSVAVVIAISISPRRVDSPSQRLAVEVETLRSELGQVRQMLQGDVPPSHSIVAGRVSKIEEDIAGLKGLLLQDPNVTLTLPLIKRDIEELKTDNTDLRNNLSSVTSLSKWFIGTLALGMISLVMSVVLKK